MSTPVMTNPDTERRDALVGRLFQAAISTLDVFSIYVGDRLGLYEALAKRGANTAGELATATETQERYVREWLEQQATTGILEVEDAGAEALVRRYRLPAGHREVLVDRDSLNYLTALLRLVVGATKPLPALLRAFRVGGGVPYPDYGPDTLAGIAEINRPMFLNLLGTAWLPAVPELHARLQAEPPARVADVGCGAGWSSIAIARAYPKAQVHGFDVVERLNYGFSVLHCLAVGMAESPSAGTCTVMRPPTLRRNAAGAGFRAVEILPIENDFWRFYRLVP